eukprot:TRINITY_DN13087_c0_g1_i5.p1 TRINITY_DN13087_c0_g1~~TRINITY_DN13087_c0_g1_i5.p1  ORF type:complete len:117 (-),score=6.48 TRINITY_DN13087_c0_g1_i5:81-431(-)
MIICILLFLQFLVGEGLEASVGVRTLNPDSTLDSSEELDILDRLRHRKSIKTGDGDAPVLSASSQKASPSASSNSDAETITLSYYVFGLLALGSCIVGSIFSFIVSSAYFRYKRRN